MIDFFQDTVWVTAGVIACVFWLLLIMGFVVEMYDTIFKKDKDEDNVQ